MSDKCMNSGCGMFSTMMPMASNCAYMWENGAKNDCPIFTTTPTTSIPVVELEELRKTEAQCVGNEAALAKYIANIAELEPDKVRLDWIEKRCKIVEHPGQSTADWYYDYRQGVNLRYAIDKVSK